MHVGAAWGGGGVLWMSVDKGIPPTSPSWCIFLDPTIKWRNQTEAIQELKRKKKFFQMILGQRLFPGGSDGQDGQESACNVEDSGSVSKLGRAPGEGNVSHSSILA